MERCGYVKLDHTHVGYGSAVRKKMDVVVWQVTGLDVVVW